MDKMNLEGMFKGQETPEQKEKRWKSTLFSACIQGAVAIAMVVIGNVYHKDCKYSNATLFLQIYGSVVMAGASLKIWGYFTRNKFGEKGMKGTNAIVPILDLVEFVLTIVGSVWVFGAYSSTITDETESASEFYCHVVPFNMAFYHLIVQWIMFPFKICCGLCICCGICFAAGAAVGMQQQQQEQPHEVIA